MSTRLLSVDDETGEDASCFRYDLIQDGGNQKSERWEEAYER